MIKFLAFVFSFLFVCLLRRNFVMAGLAGDIRAESVRGVKSASISHADAIAEIRDDLRS
jgi:hypothetical protein